MDKYKFTYWSRNLGGFQHSASPVRCISHDIWLKKMKALHKAGDGLICFQVSGKIHESRHYMNQRRAITDVRVQPCPDVGTAWQLASCG